MPCVQGLALGRGTISSKCLDQRELCGAPVPKPGPLGTESCCRPPTFPFSSTHTPAWCTPQQQEYDQRNYRDYTRRLALLYDPVLPAA